MRSFKVVTKPNIVIIKGISQKKTKILECYIYLQKVDFGMILVNILIFHKISFGIKM